MITFISLNGPSNAGGGYLYRRCTVRYLECRLNQMCRKCLGEPDLKHAIDLRVQSRAVAGMGD
jgi:hypothetical protein